MNSLKLWVLEKWYTHRFKHHLAEVEYHETMRAHHQAAKEAAVERKNFYDVKILTTRMRGIGPQLRKAMDQNKSPDEVMRLIQGSPKT